MIVALLQQMVWKLEHKTFRWNFVESVEASYPGHYVRFVGGAIFFAGMLIMAYNVYMTVRGRQREEAAAPATPLPAAAPGGGA